MVISPVWFVKQMRLLFLYEMVCSIKWPNPSFRKCLLASMKSHRWCFYQHFCHQRICNSYFMKLKPSEMESYYVWSLLIVHFFSTTYKDGIPVGGKSPSTAKAFPRQKPLHGKSPSPGSTGWKWLIWVKKLGKKNVFRLLPGADVVPPTGILRMLLTWHTKIPCLLLANLGDGRLTKVRTFDLTCILSRCSMQKSMNLLSLSCHLYRFNYWQ